MEIPFKIMDKRGKMKDMRDVLQKIIDQDSMPAKDLIRKLESEYQLKEKGISIVFNNSDKTYSIKVKKVKLRRDLESMIFRILRYKKSPKS
jgi:hypothetical protein